MLLNLLEDYFSAKQDIVILIDCLIPLFAVVDT